VLKQSINAGHVKEVGTRRFCIASNWPKQSSCSSSGEQVLCRRKLPRSNIRHTVKENECANTEKPSLIEGLEMTELNQPITFCASEELCELNISESDENLFRNVHQLQDTVSFADFMLNFIIFNHCL